MSQSPPRRGAQRASGDDAHTIDAGALGGVDHVHHIRQRGEKDHEQDEQDVASGRLDPAVARSR